MCKVFHFDFSNTWKRPRTPSQNFQNKPVAAVPLATLTYAAGYVYSCQSQAYFENKFLVSGYL